MRPRLHLSEPKLREMGLDAVQLSWKPAELPLYQRSRTPMYYGVEMMELPSTNWVPVARKVPETSYLVTGLKPDRDYKFRVTAETDQAKSEPSLSAVLHRKPGKCNDYSKLQCRIQNAEKLRTSKGDFANDSLQLRPSSKWELLLKERIRSRCSFPL